ncbi:MAG: hypothetical protein Q7S12_02165 [bacterium]|nr:hypothetical protein [bacterium]
MMTEYRGHEENSGKLNEHFTLGEINPTPEYLKELKDVQKKNGYVSYEDSLHLVRKFSPYDPINPAKPFLNDLRIEFIDALGFTKDEDMDRIKIFTAVGSPLDHWHGADVFIEIENENHRGSYIVMFDLKTDAKVESEIKRNNLHDLKAHVLIYDIPDSREDNKKYLVRMGEIGEEAAEVFRKMENRAAA